jgi:hypothetical protein
MSVCTPHFHILSLHECTWTRFQVQFVPLLWLFLNNAGILCLLSLHMISRTHVYKESGTQIIKPLKHWIMGWLWMVDLWLYGRKQLWTLRYDSFSGDTVKIHKKSVNVACFQANIQIQTSRTWNRCANHWTSTLSTVKPLFIIFVGGLKKEHWIRENNRWGSHSWNRIRSGTI